MINAIKKIIRENSGRLEASDKDFKAIYETMFSHPDLVLSEHSDGFRIIKQTYGEIKKQIEGAAAAIYEQIGASHSYVALEMENSPLWVVAFWAILMSGNKPYLVNLRYPAHLSKNLVNTLDIKYAVSNTESSLGLKTLLIDTLCGDSPLSDGIFENEIAFSSSATSMNEVICFFGGEEIAAQILNFKDIIKREPRIAKHYKGSLKQLAFLPFYHVFGLFAVYFWYTFFGRTLVFLRDYSADTILRTCKKHKVTHIFAVPVLWHTIEKQVRSAAAEQGEKKRLKLEKAIKFTTALQNIFPSFGAAVAKSLTKEVTEKLFGRSVMFTISGGSYLRESALSLINGLGYSLHNGYGMSEIGITSVELRRKAKARNENSIGQPFSAVEYKIDQNGILLVRGATLCKKKLKNGRAEQFDGWFNTGDRITADNDGNYFILGRDGDTVIGENGENINPDSVEKLFDFSSANMYSVLGLGDKDKEELSLVVQINPFAGEAVIAKTRSEAYSVNETLPTVSQVKRFYFTTDELCPPSAVKVSRTQLKAKIEKGEIKITPFNEMKVSCGTEADSPLMKKIIEIISEVLHCPLQSIEPDTHIFYDLGATSIQYFTLLTKLSESFTLSDYDKNDKYCYTPREICEYIERHL